MLSTVYVRWNGDLYEITADVFGDIVVATAYRDNRSRIGERLDVNNLPPEVYNQAQAQLSKRWTEDD